MKSQQAKQKQKGKKSLVKRAERGGVAGKSVGNEIQVKGRVDRIQRKRSREKGGAGDRPSVATTRSFFLPSPPVSDLHMLPNTVQYLSQWSTAHAEIQTPPPAPHENHPL